MCPPPPRKEMSLKKKIAEWSKRKKIQSFSALPVTWCWEDGFHHTADSKQAIFCRAEDSLWAERATGPTQLAGLCAPQVNTAWSKGINYPAALGFRLSASPLTSHPPHRQSRSRERVSMWPGRRERQGFTDFWIKKEKNTYPDCVT